MGSAPRTEALRIEAAQFVERALAKTDRRRSSALWAVAHAAVIVVIWSLPAQHSRQALEIQLELWAFSWVAWAIAVRAGRSEAVAQALEVANEAVAACTTAFALYISGTLTGPLWLVMFARAFAWLPRRRTALLAQRWSLVVSNAVLALASIADGNVAGATLVLGLLAGQIVALEVSSHVVRQGMELEAESEAMHAELERFEVRDETDRIARELHDGLGAELVALLLSLDGKLDVQVHTQRILVLLEELRSVVWSLRGGRGSVAEFQKLLRARVRMTLPSTPVLGSTNPEHRLYFVEPEAALAILGAVNDVLRRAAELPSLSEVAIAVEADPLAVRLQLNGVQENEIATIVQEAHLRAKGHQAAVLAHSERTLRVELL